MCLSLTLCNIPPPTECDLYNYSRRSSSLTVYARLQWAHTAQDDLLQTWYNAEDLEAFEHVAKEAVEYLVGPVSISLRVLSRAGYLLPGL